MFRVRFEVSGKVQGVWFRKYTKDFAASVGVKGWVQNSRRGTVIGVAEGSNDALDKMEHFLKTQGYIFE